MRLPLQDKRVKQLGLKRFFKSFTYNFEGFKYALLNEQSMIIHFIVATVVIILGFILKLNKYEWMITLLIIACVISSEFINTAIEAVVDMVMKEKHPLAKIAKDTASTAVGVFALVALIIGCIIFVPKILLLVGLL